VCRRSGLGGAAAMTRPRVRPIRMASLHSRPVDQNGLPTFCDFCHSQVCAGGSAAGQMQVFSGSKETTSRTFAFRGTPSPLRRSWKINNLRAEIPGDP
jgi:hypothetical protein